VKVDVPMVIVLDGQSHLAHASVDYSVKVKKDVPQSRTGK